MCARAPAVDAVRGGRGGRGRVRALHACRLWRLWQGLLRGLDASAAKAPAGPASAAAQREQASEGRVGSGAREAPPGGAQRPPEVGFGARGFTRQRSRLARKARGAHHDAVQGPDTRAAAPAREKRLFPTPPLALQTFARAAVLRRAAPAPKRRPRAASTRHRHDAPPRAHPTLCHVSAEEKPRRRCPASLLRALLSGACAMRLSLAAAAAAARLPRPPALRRRAAPPPRGVLRAASHTASSVSAATMAPDAQALIDELNAKYSEARARGARAALALSRVCADAWPRGTDTSVSVRRFTEASRITSGAPRWRCRAPASTVRRPCRVAALIQRAAERSAVASDLALALTPAAALPPQS